MNIVPLNSVDPETDYLHCSKHPCCEGTHLIPNHDEICDQGEDCDLDNHWRGCKWCKIVCAVCGEYEDICRCHPAVTATEAFR